VLDEWLLRLLGLHGVVADEQAYDDMGVKRDHGTPSG
jgi:hypothetical protein